MMFGISGKTRKFFKGASTKHHLNDQNLYGASIKEISNFRNTRKHVGE